MRRFINELVDGEAIEEAFLLTEKQLRANRNANLYLLAELRDRTGVIMARMWNATEESVAHINAGDFVQVKGKVQVYQGGLQMIITHIYPVAADTLDPTEFFPRSEQDVGKLFSRLRERLLAIQNPHIRALMECFLIDDALVQAYCSAPAGIKAHHAYKGGLLEHVVTMLEAAHRIADLYPHVDQSVLLAGIFLHDIGKIRELSYETGFAYTDEGQLIGHLVIGVELLNEKVRQTSELTGEPFPAELLLRLKHLVISHHGSYQFGSPKLPMTPEAIVLHHLDNLDAKVHEFVREIQDDPNPLAHWTPFNARLDRKLFKGTRQPPPAVEG